MKRLLAFMEVHSETEAEIKILERWKLQNAKIIEYSTAQQLHFWEEADEAEFEDDVVPPEFLEAVTRLDRDEYKVEEMMAETMLDLDQVVDFLAETRRFKPSNDDKLNELKKRLKSKDLNGQKVLIFTEYADTARYLFRQLVEAGIEGVSQVDSGTGGNRANVIKRFSPYYNGTTSAELEDEGQSEIRVLISTDILSEGLNLQDASRMINYDIHWNPVRLMQRIGRVDRRIKSQRTTLMSPSREARCTSGTSCHLTN
jgi:ERCC4-related helicase